MNKYKVDILAFASHPDDIELGCAGTIIAHIAAGKKVGIVDLTRGELGTRGTPEVRAAEAEEAARILGVSARENLGLADAFFRNDKEHQLRVVQAVRKYQPEIVLMNAIHDRHPDHGKGSALVSDACFMAGLKMISTFGDDGEPQPAWRPKVAYHFIQDRLIVPDIVVDVTPYWEQKMESIRAFRSQFYNPDDASPNTYISSPEFLKFVEARALELGHSIGVTYGEGFTKERHIGVRNLFDLI
ncbi:bacillithiol biosynthesis deacetylase BshB1 [Pontibacter qinzhouensis]|uniref:Bacillithiol biosynthesis deacetylase BshB1 n=1 Tax=Pontibacter qinzhouensis TaxID=2603253 RepID=A0A5C8J2B8_9BACT|nr:bacillithiol biosynthesis deacetylase BshB1 [Pontibacter qinzhouensis]TXK29468.1 bacillithiol biosynthesis deacetylase BshB1 [Pontibacter qinzhouensis]